MKRWIAFALTPLVRFVEWLFSSRAPGVDLALCLFASSWAALMVFHPEIFDRGTFVGMNWLPDLIWGVFFGVLGAVHALGTLRPEWRAMRYTACLFSAWIWISVSVSFARIEITTGVLTYAIIGAGAFFGAIYLSGQPRKEG